MKPQVALRLALAVLALSSLSSCSLPPRDAWRLIRREGLGPYLAMEMGKRPFPEDVKPLRDAVLNRPKSPAWKNAQQQLSSSSPYLQKPATSASKAGSDAPAIASPKPKAESRMVFEVKPDNLTDIPSRSAPSKPAPSSAKAKSQAKASSSTSKSSANRVADNSSSKKKAPSTSATPPSKPESAAAPKKTPAVATAPTPPKKEEPAPAPANKPAPSTAAKPAPAPKPAADLPFGSPVPGRVGLVHSPYAGKLQLVDVSGLTPGQEVKCPYSGKLFRVPSGDQAAAKKTESTPPPAKADGDKQQ